MVIANDVLNLYLNYLAQKMNFRVNTKYNTCVTAELGDYDPALHTEGFISEFRFVPNQVKIWFYWAVVEAYSEPCQTSNMEFFRKIIIDFHSSTGLAKSSILDVWQGSEYASVLIVSEFKAYLILHVHISM